MLVELVNDPEGSDNWYVDLTDGARMYCTSAGVGVRPKEFIDKKSNVKAIIKLKREGFTAEEITELYEAKVV